MLSQLFVLSPRGDLLLFRDYRGDADPAVSGAFYEAVSALGAGVPPVAVRACGRRFVHVRRAGLWLCATALKPADPALPLLSLLLRLGELLNKELGTLSEESLRMNVPLVYELLDEVFVVVVVVVVDFYCPAIVKEAVSSGEH